MQESLSFLTDSALLRRYHQGDQRAFEHLVERYQAPLFCFLMGILRDPDTTEEVMQHVWIQCACVFAPCQETETASLKGWVFRVAHNRAMDLLRRGTREQRITVSLAALSLDTEDESPSSLWVQDPRPGPDILAEQQEIQEVLLQALATLSSVSQQIVYFRLWHQHTYGEIGQRLGMSAVTVKTSFHRARLRLSKALTDWVATGVPPKRRKRTPQRPVRS